VREKGVAEGLDRTHTHMQVSQWNVADDVVEDFDAGLEYGEAESILKAVQKGDAREYLVRWGSAHALYRGPTAYCRAGSHKAVEASLLLSKASMCLSTRACWPHKTLQRSSASFAVAIACRI
jgi:hypothetical protein